MGWQTADTGGKGGGRTRVATGVGRAVTKEAQTSDSLAGCSPAAPGAGRGGVLVVVFQGVEVGLCCKGSPHCHMPISGGRAGSHPGKWRLSTQRHSRTGAHRA